MADDISLFDRRMRGPAGIAIAAGIVLGLLTGYTVGAGTPDGPSWTLVVPFALVPLGVVPDPFALGNPVVAAAAIGWAGCALPSPQDFALVWYPERALAAHE